MQTATLADIKFQASLVIMEDHEDPVLSPETIAGRLWISRRQLDRAFSGGLSVCQLSSAYRVSTAVKLIRSRTIRDLETVGRLSGFQNRNTFREQFTRLAGVQPSRAYDLLPSQLA